MLAWLYRQFANILQHLIMKMLFHITVCLIFFPQCLERTGNHRKIHEIKGIIQFLECQNEFQERRYFQKSFISFNWGYWECADVIHFFLFWWNILKSWRPFAGNKGRLSVSTSEIEHSPQTLSKTKLIHWNFCWISPLEILNLTGFLEEMKWKGSPLVNLLNQCFCEIKQLKKAQVLRIWMRFFIKAERQTCKYLQTQLYFSSAQSLTDHPNRPCLSMCEKPFKA